MRSPVSALRAFAAALPAQMNRQERDRVGRLLRMEFDGAEPDRAVVSEPPNLPKSVT